MLQSDLAYTGTAIGGGTDYTASSSQITIPAGMLTGDVTITGDDDLIDEADETVIVDITTVANGTEDLVQQETITITDDDAAPTVSIAVAPASISENGGISTVEATLSAVSGLDVTVNLAYTGTASGADYTASSSQITIPAGMLTGDVTITGDDDLIDEADETVIVDIATVTNGTEDLVQQETITITDDDAAPTVSIAVVPASISENGGISTVEATLSAVSGLDVTVNLAYTGTASGADYTASSSQITIPAGMLTGDVTITGDDDLIAESDETVIVDITTVANGTEDLVQQETITITDDDAAPTVSIAVSPASISENGGISTVEATLSAVSGLDVTVNLAYTGTASGADYTASSSQITIPAGMLTGDVTITGDDDLIDEVDETVIVDIATVTNGTEDLVQQETITITDDDAAPTVSIAVAPASISENGGISTVEATLSAVSGLDVTVNLAYTGTASGADYTASSSQITIPAGMLTGDVTITGDDDLIDEADETVIVDITTVANGTEDLVQQETITITDDDAAPTVSIAVAPASISENGGISTVEATLSAVSGLDVTVNLAYTGTASGADYTASSSQITIPAGMLTGDVTITGDDDLIDEADETVIVDIATVTNGTEDLVQQETITITDDDAAPTVSIAVAPASISENGGISTVEATLSAVSGLDVTVNLAYTGTASGADYTASSSQITIPAGMLTGDVTITGDDDLIDEADETVIVDIATVANGTEDLVQQETITITDDDAAPTVSIAVSPASISENGGISTVEATLSAVSGLDVTVNLAYTGTASGADYTASSSQITIPAGMLTGDVTITGDDDLIDEADETVIVDIATVTNGTEDLVQQETITITDDDAAPTVSIAVSPASISENGGISTVEATLSAVSGLDVTVNLAYTGTAIGGGTDYTASSSQITIPAGMLTGDVTITGDDDLIDEADETVIVDITTVANGTEDLVQQETITITDDDAAPTVSIAVAPASISENGGISTVEATLSAVSGLDVTVNLAYTGTASGADYTASSSQITIPAGMLTGDVTITGDDDLIDEADETVIVDIATVTNGTEDLVQQETITITDDDAAPTVSIAVAPASISENGGISTVEATLSAVSGLDVTVNLAYTGTAIGGGTDYTASSSQITIPAGMLTGDVTITGDDDLIDEADETVIVDITTVANGTEDLVQQETITITDDDAAPTVSIAVSPASISENGGISTVEATLSAVSGLDVTVNLAYTGTASGADYTASSSQITIPAGMLTGDVTITGDDDLIDEADETVIVDITTVTNGTEDLVQQETITITDDDAAPTVSIAVSPASISENGGVSTVEATLSAVSGLDVTVNLAYTGTASGADYTASSSQITIPAGMLTGDVTITGDDDLIDEADETVIVDITTVTNGTEDLVQQETITITDDDDAPTVNLGESGSPIEEDGGESTITATLSEVSGLDVTINLSYTGTATNGTDYSASSTQITIPAGSTTGSVTITAVQDVLIEGPETVLVDVSSLTNGTDASTQQTITIRDDDVPPVISACAEDKIINVDAACEAIIPDLTGEVVATDDGVIVSYTQSPAAGDVVTTGVHTVIITVTDDDGNETTCTADVTVNDVTNPTASNPLPIDVECAVDVPAPDITVVTDEADNCTVAPTVAFVSDVSNGNTCPEIITRTYSVTDDFGNAITVTQTITINDKTLPTFTAPADITIYRDATCVYDASVTATGDVTDEADNCGVGEATYSDVVDISDPCAIVITRTWSLVDNCDNNAPDQIQIIRVEDNTLPTFTAPADITIYRDATCVYDASVSATGDVTNEADNCGVGEATYSDVVDNSDPCSIVITRTWSLVDDCGNAAATQNQIITVEDNTAPTFTVPANITIYSDASCAYDASVSATGDVTDEADNCGVGEATFTDVVDATDPCAIKITRTWSLVDDCGNVTTQDQIITVEDNIAPTFTVPADITIYSDASCAYDASVSATGDVTDEADNCGVGEANFVDVVDNSDPCAITITRTWSLVDDCGNPAATQDQIITVEDNILPTFTAPADITIYSDATCAYDTSVAATGDVLDESDNCSVGLEATYMDVVDASDSCAITITRTWSLIDNCGNAAADQVQIITVEDNIAPTFTAPADITIFRDEGCTYDASITATGDVTDEADNCSVGLEAGFVDVVDNTDPTNVIITRTWSLVDNCGNAALDQIQIITVIDIIPPVLSGCPADITAISDTSYCGDVVSWIPPVADDNCPGVVLTSTHNPGDIFPVGITTVTYTATDASGLTAECSFDVIMASTEPVEISGPSPVCTLTEETYTVTDPGSHTFQWSVTNGTIVGSANESSVTVFWTGALQGTLNVILTSGSGCTNTGSADIEINPIPPVILGGDTYICDGDVFDITPEGEYDSYLWHDGSTEPSYSTDQEEWISVEVTDSYGCAHSDSIYLTVEDLPEVDLGNDTTLCGAESLLLDAGSDGIFYSWSTGDITQQITVYQGQQEISVVVDDENECTNSDTILIGTCNVQFYFRDIPNAITTNGDGVNDFWNIEKLDGYSQAVVEIYDQWGVFVWKSEPGYPMDGMDEPWTEIWYR